MTNELPDAPALPSMKNLRIFVSSPGDVIEERELARQVVERLRRRYTGRLALEPVFWEDMPLQAGLSFQQQIEVVLSNQGIDVAIFIVWARLGTPPGPAIARQDGTPYVSGTEREFDLVKHARLRAIAASEAVRPDCLVYVRDDQSSFVERLRRQPTGEQSELVRQKALVEDWIRRELAAVQSASHRYERPSEFCSRLRTHLLALLDQHAGGMARAALWDTESRGAPFRGLEVFEPEHTDVFFGREDEIVLACDAFREQARRPCGAFLLLSGASGSGKSSLARAGILPTITQDELDEHVSGWRHLIVTPYELSAMRAPGAKSDLPLALLSRMSASDVLPELAPAGTSLHELAALCRTDPKLAFDSVFKPAIRRAGPVEGNAGVRTLLVIDQLEELFALADVDTAERDVFLNLLEVFAKSRSIWVLATIRSDFYPQVQEHEALLRMKGDAGQRDVRPPSVDAISHIVKEPALLAGLRFETDKKNNQTVADLILRDAATHTELLPLVEYTLRELYEQRVDGTTLTFKAYRALGGVEGALRVRAEEVFGKLSEESRASLDVVLQALVTLDLNDGSAEARATNEPLLLSQERRVRQRARLSDFSDGSPARLLVDAFIRGRLFTSDGGTVTVAHESLLRVWERAVSWGELNHDFLLTRARIVTRLKEGNRVIESGGLLNSAKAQLAERASSFTQKQREFIERSIRAERKRNLMIRVGSAIATIVVLGIVLYSSHLRERDARAGQLSAEAERELSRRDYVGAERAVAQAIAVQDSHELRELLLRARSGGISFLSGSRKSETPAIQLTSFSRDGRLLATVRSDGKSSWLAVTTSEGGRELWRIEMQASQGMPESLTLSDPLAGVRRLAIARNDHSVGVWRLAEGRPAEFVTFLEKQAGRPYHAKRVPSMAFHPQQPWILTSGEDQKLALWDHSQSPARLMAEDERAHETAIHGVTFNADGSLIGSGGGDYLAKLWQTADFVRASTKGSDKLSPSHILKAHTDSVFALAFSPDGRLLATAGYDRVVRIWDLRPKGSDQTPLAVGTLSAHEGTVLDLVFSDDSKLLASGGKDETVRVWDIVGANVLMTLVPATGVIRSISFSGLESAIHCGGERGFSSWSARGRAVAARLWSAGATVQAIAYDPKGAFLAAGGNDGKVRLRDADHSDSVVLDPELDDESINALAISPDGQWLAAGGEGKVIHLWERGATWRDWRRVQSAAGTLAQGGAIWGLCFDAKQRWLASSNTDIDRRIRRWRAGDWSLLDESPELPDTVYSLACDKTGTQLVSGDSNGRVIVWKTGLTQLNRIDEIRNVDKGETNVWSVATASNPFAVLSGNSDGHVYRWVPAASGAGDPGKRSGTSADEAAVNPTINSVSYSDVNGWTAAAGDGNSVEIYDRDLKRVHSLKGHDGTVWYVTFDPQGERLAYGSQDRLLRIWDLKEMARNLSSDTPEDLVAETDEKTGVTAIAAIAETGQQPSRWLAGLLRW